MILSRKKAHDGQDPGKHIEDINHAKLPICHDNGVYTDDDDTYRKRK